MHGKENVDMYLHPNICMVDRSMASRDGGIERLQYVRGYVNETMCDVSVFRGKWERLEARG